MPRLYRTKTCRGSGDLRPLYTSAVPSLQLMPWVVIACMLKSADMTARVGAAVASLLFGAVALGTSTNVQSLRQTGSLSPISARLDLTKRCSLYLSLKQT